MKSSFPEFYRLPPDEYQKVWDECLFVFDANALLNLYRYSQSACKEFLDILGDEKIKDRVWIPHQFAFEFQRNRLNVVAEQRRSYSFLIGKLEELIKQFKRHPFLEMRSLLQPSIDTIRKTARNHPKWQKNDPIRETITKLFEGKVGAPYSNEENKKIYEEGRLRFEKKIPPGYLDNSKKDESKFGDLLGWKQIMDHAKKTRKPIIFITNELDEDWWWRVDGESIGARYELIKEIKEYAGVLFVMYSWEWFLKRSATYLQKKINKKIEKEIEEIAIQAKDEAERSVDSEPIISSSSNVDGILSEEVGLTSDSEVS